MKIRIKTNNRRFGFCFPTGLIFNKTAVRIANTIGRRFASDSLKDIPPEALELLCAELGRVKRKYGKWELVKVESSSGEIVEIIL